MNAQVNYLLLYEAMVRHQDLEFDATHDHVALTVERIRHLGRKGPAPSPKMVDAPELMGEDDDGPGGMLTYVQMRRCLLRLGYTWNRSLPAAEDHDYDDDVSVMSAASASTFGGGTVGSAAAARDIIATDAQLIMLLTTLVEMEERHRAGRGDAEGKEELSRGLYLPEFIQAYKLIIGGMQSLQTFPAPDDAPDALKKACGALGIPYDKEALREIRTRSRERTLGLLRLFGPNTKLYEEAFPEQSAGESTTSTKKSDALSGPSKSMSKSKTATKVRGNMTAKDGLLPRLTEEEIRRMVHSKDTALAQILEEHETEMNVMATNMEELRLRGLKTQEKLRRRRKRTRVAVVIGALLLVCGGAAYEHYRRHDVEIQIKAGRESERQADAATIKALKGDVASLKSKLNDAEATIRYEENRHAEVKRQYEITAKALEETEGKWLLDQRDLELCRVQRKELDADLTTAQARNTEVEEEVVWCRDRLATAERAMEGMERALKKSREAGSETEGGAGATVLPSFADLARELDQDAKGLVATGTANGADDAKKGGKQKNKPVKMEMKYNKRFRNAVILRQVYSAVAGAVAGMFFPGLSKVISLLLV